MNSISSTGMNGNLPRGKRPQRGGARRDGGIGRYITKLTAVLAVTSAMVLPLLPKTMVEANATRNQQVAQAAADRVTAGGGMLWLEDEDTAPATAAE